MLLAHSPDQISAFWTGVGAIATVAAAVVAIVTLIALRRDSADRSRPVIAASLERTVLSPGAVDLVVKNVGSGVAKNVRTTFLPSIGPDSGGLGSLIRRQYGLAIPTIAPAQTMINGYAVLKRDDSGQPDENVPETFTITFDYEDPRGRKYRDSYDLTLRTLATQTYTTRTVTGKDAHVRRLAEALESIARNIGRP